MSEHLTATQIALLLLYAVAMSLGQLMFKAAAQLAAPQASLADKVIASSTSPYFICALVLYLLLSLAWVWILTFTPLSYAYPFVALAFGVTPVLAAAFFGDPISSKVLVGCALIGLGIIVVAS